MKKKKDVITLTLIFVTTFSIVWLMIDFLAVASSDAEMWQHTEGRGIVNFYVRSAESGSSSRNTHALAPYMISWIEIEGIHHLMIPNSADINYLPIYFIASAPVFVWGEDIELFSGEYTDVFASGEPVFLTSDGLYYEVIAMQGSEIATLFIQTESGNLDYIHESRRNRETAQILMICANGETILYDGTTARLNGRGNSTWIGQPKRPYNIRLTNATDLLSEEGDARHHHWALLADRFDNTRLRNTISHYLAQEVGLEATVRFRPVDVYINNQYMGLYLLTERIRIDTILPITDLEAITETVNQRPLSEFEHVGNMAFEPGARRYFDILRDPPDITGGYLLEWQLEARFDSQPSGFVTERAQAIVLRAPIHASRAQIDYISTFIQEMEDAVYSPTGYNSLGRHFTEYIDIRSFAKMYVFQEFIMNIDAAASSFFIYKESDLISDGLLRAAPPWDFDLTLGIRFTRDGIDLTDPELFYVNQGRISWNPDYTPHILAALWQHDIFRELSIEIWHNYFVPVLQENFVESIREHDALIRDSTRMEWTRWEISSYRDGSVIRVLNFIESRINFLNEKWSN